MPSGGGHIIRAVPHSKFASPWILHEAALPWPDAPTRSAKEPAQLTHNLQLRSAAAKVIAFVAKQSTTSSSRRRSLRRTAVFSVSDARHHRLALRVQPSLSDQQAGADAAIDEAQAPPATPFPFAKGDPAPDQGFACGGKRDRQPEPVFRAEQRARVMRANDDPGLRTRRARRRRGFRRLRKRLAADRVGSASCGLLRRLRVSKLQRAF